MPEYNPRQAGKTIKMIKSFEQYGMKRIQILTPEPKFIIENLIQEYGEIPEHVEVVTQPTCHTCKHDCDYNNEPCSDCYVYSRWEEE